MSVTTSGAARTTSTSPQTIGQRYELSGPPLRGGMGDLYRAYDLSLDREVAVKLMRADLADDDQRTELVRRFRREARLLARMRHPGTPAVFDTGEDDGRPFLVMEYVEGATLRNLIDEVQPVPRDWTVYVIAQICAVLARAHELSLVHRDLKPDNVLLCADGTVKVVDFGLAIVTDSSSTHLTPPGVVTGDWRYRAPECDLGIASSRTDLYAVGRILEELLEQTPADDDLWELAALLTHNRPQDRPKDATDVLAPLTPLLRRPSPLPGFVTATTPEGYVETTTGLTGGASRRGQTGHPEWTPAALRRIRASAAEHAEQGRPGRAVDLLRTVLDDPHAPEDALMDVRRDLANLLVEAGETGDALRACNDALTVMTRRLPEDHPAVVSLRLTLARLHARAGDVTTAADLYATVAEDLGGQASTRSERATATRELAIMQAGAGDRAGAEAILTGLLADLRDAAHVDDEQVIATVDALMLVRAPVRRYVPPARGARG
ncbi:Protein kinase domain-containing protein [Micromonospora inositola]|uniref:non-specific serine/threonine protein kinase n=2 Tax=Micromonospora inositola TaxID=47865 RepID=A0A1C5JHV5_9ACTN|nr:Protein kinase domain-containing protein [Micromonospora inositola]